MKTMDTVILNPVIPYVGPISGHSFSPNKLVKLEGTIPPHAFGFDINLQCGPNTIPHDDIALQIVIRFTNGYLSLNSSQLGIWGKEIRLLNLPIKADQKFEITVLCEFNQYKVAINNEHYCVFPQTTPSEKISHISINGDVSITRISYESICDAILNTNIPLDQSKSQFNDVQHSDSPISYDIALNRSDDADSQNNSIKVTLIKASKIIFIFLCVIAVCAVCGGIIYLVTQYDSNYTGFNRYIPSVDFKDMNLDMDKEAEKIKNSFLEMEKWKEEIKKTNDMLAKAKQMNEDSKSFFDFVQASNLKYQNKKVSDVLENTENIDEKNKMVSDFLQEISDLIAKSEKENHLGQNHVG